MNVLGLLNDLISLHGRSLAVYLADAEPYASPGSSQAQDVLSMVAADDQLTVDKLAEELIEKGGAVTFGAFPASFSGLHDLSMDYLVDRLIEDQQKNVAKIQLIATQLASDAGANALADEALGAAKGHLESFRELRASLAAS